MRGTTLDFLKLVAAEPDLAREFIAFAARHDFELCDEIAEAVQGSRAGGAEWPDVAAIAARRHPTERCPSE